MYCALVVIVTGLKIFTATDLNCGSCLRNLDSYKPVLVKADKFYTKRHHPIIAGCIHQESV